MNSLETKPDYNVAILSNGNVIKSDLRGYIQSNLSKCKRSVESSALQLERYCKSRVSTTVLHNPLNTRVRTIHSVSLI
jgi:hypothetical protein